MLLTVKSVAAFVALILSEGLELKKKDGTRNVYWQCYQKIYDSKTCKDSVLIREDALQEAFIQIYNAIAENKY